MKSINVFMYTKGTGSGHLAQINAVYKGFEHAKIPVSFSACAYRSKYKHILHKNIKIWELGKFPEGIDIFICDWRSDDFTNQLPISMAKIWFGLRRLGKMPSTFPPHYTVIAIEPGVKGDKLFYPIVSIYPDELKSKKELLFLLNFTENEKRPLVLLAENGAYPKHIKRVFDIVHNIENAIIIKSSNNPIASSFRTLDYYPIAVFFKTVDYLIIGAGYNSVHEAILYADLDRVQLINVGGDDQSLRLRKMDKWTKKNEPENHLLANFMVNSLLNK